MTADERLAPGPAGSWGVGDRIAGTYEVREVLGEGGMGVVYRVRHLGWEADLAVKSPLAPEMRGDAARDRFIQEAETWVGFSPHPHVCTCHYLRTLDGVPRLFVEYMDAGSLTRWIEDGRLYRGDSRDVMTRVLDIAIQTAWGLVHAHDHGVVHQDVKPANILLDGAGNVKITDFGLARAQPESGGPLAVPGPADEVPGARTLRVSNGGMTRAYASPEQYARGAVGRRTDVWGLAVSLLEMLVGGVTWNAGPAAGAVLAALRADGFRARPAGVEVPAALDALLARCLRTDPAERPDMAAVAAELTELYAAIAGTPYPRANPHPGDLRADELNNRALSLLDLGRDDEALALLDEACDADPQHPEAVYNRGLLRWRSGDVTDEQLVNDLEVVDTNSSDPYRVRHLLARVHLERGDAAAAAELIEESGPEAADLRHQLATVRAATEDAPAPLGHIETDARVALTADGRHAWAAEDDAVTIWRLPGGRRVCTLAGHDGQVYGVTVTAAGDQALTCGGDGTVRVWELPLGHRARTLTGHQGQERGGAHLTVGQAIRIPGYGDPDAELPENKSVYSVCEAPGGTALSAGADGTVREWDIGTGACLRVLTFDEAPAGPLPDDFVSLGFVVASTHELCVSGDGRLVLCSRGARIWVWDYATGDVVHVLTGHTNSVTSLATTPDGRYALSGSNDATAAVWDLAGGELVRRLSGHVNTAGSVRVTGDGEHAVTHDHAARVWELGTGRCVRTIAPSSAAGPAEDQGVLTITPSGDVYGTRWRGGVPAAFQVARPRTPADLVEADRLVADLVTSAGTAKAAGDVPRALALLREAREKPGYERASHVTEAWHRLYDHCVRTELRSVRLEAMFTGFLREVGGAVITPDGAYAAAHVDDGRFQVWDLASRRVVWGLDLRGVDVVGMTPDGAYVAAGGGEGVTVVDTRSGEGRHLLPHPVRVELIHATPGGERLVTSDSDRAVRVWDLATGACALTFSLSTGDGDFHWTRALCVTPDGRHIVSAHNDGTLRLWELTAGRCVRAFDPGSSHVRSGCVTGDGRHLVTAGDDGLRVRDLVTGAEPHALPGHGGMVHEVSATADGRHVLSAGDDGVIRLWEPATGRCLRTITGHTGTVETVSVSADGHRAVSGGRDRTLRVWELDWDLAERDLGGWRDELEPRLGAFLAGCASRPAETHAPGPELWTEEDLALLRSRLAASGYAGLSEEDVRDELLRLTHAALTVEPDRLRPEEVKPYQAAILTGHASRRAAAREYAKALDASLRARGVLGHLAATDPETARHDLVDCLLSQAVWLGRLRRPDEAIAINHEAIGLAWSLAERTRVALLAQLLHNHYSYAHQAKRRDETEECLRLIRREFAPAIYTFYLPGLDHRAGPADPVALRQAIAAARDYIGQYTNMPADHPQRLPGRVVGHCALARLMLANGERDEALFTLNRIARDWVRWRKGSKQNQCDPLAIGMDLLEMSDTIGIRIITRMFRRSLGLPRA